MDNRRTSAKTRKSTNNIYSNDDSNSNNKKRYSNMGNTRTNDDNSMVIWKIKKENRK